MLMLSLPLLAFAGPEASVWGVHPVSALLLAVYLVGARSTAGIRESPMWRPVLTRVTRTDLAEREHPGAPSTPALALRFAGLAVVLGLAGIVLARAGGRIADETGLTETAVGALMTAVATSLPELVTTLAAVRRGAVQLAVGGIIGGNTFDVLFVVLSDISYRQGSIYHAIAPGDLFWLAVGMAMTAVLLIGLIVRERTGPGGIGRESVALLAIYGGAVVVQAMLV
jgi:cation:H+ antiporter